jgi:hypothetical protein
MKLKFLSIFLALGMFVLGTGLSAQDSAQAPELPQDVAGSLLCMALKNVIPDDTTWPKVCQTACADDPNVSDMGCCTQQLVAESKNTKNKSQAKFKDLVAKIKKVCGSSFSPVCSGRPLKGTCRSETVRQTCGYVCCNIDPKTITTCMNNNNDTCDNYTKPSCDPANLKATW